LAAVDTSDRASLIQSLASLSLQRFAAGDAELGRAPRARREKPAALSGRPPSRAVILCALRRGRLIRDPVRASAGQAHSRGRDLDPRLSRRAGFVLSLIAAALFPRVATPHRRRLRSRLLLIQILAWVIPQPFALRTSVTQILALLTLQHFAVRSSPIRMLAPLLVRRSELRTSPIQILALLAAPRSHLLPPF
jgi:hypothetical protein